MSFIEEAKRVKKEKKITSAQLSRDSGIPLGTLTKLFSGDITDIKLTHAIKIARALGTAVAELIGEEYSALTAQESTFLESFRLLDDHARRTVLVLMDKEIERAGDEQDRRAMTVREGSSEKKITLPLFYLPVSAGTGAILDNSDSENIQVRSTFTTRAADFALRVSGNSMEPTFENGDILLVQKQNYVEKGELGIFVADGEGYFKRFMGKYLHSLNPAYEDIPLSRFTDFLCCGKVIGNLKKKS